MDNKNQSSAFHSSRTEQPFTHCSVCNESFGNEWYVIEKAYQRLPSQTEHEVWFEYALCYKCKQNMAQQVSKESMERIQQWAMENQPELNVFSDDSEVDLTSCSFTHKPITELPEYHLIGVFKNGKLQFSPVVFGAQAMEAYQEILSEETKGFFRDFYDDFIDVPPALAKILDKDLTPIIL